MPRTVSFVVPTFRRPDTLRETLGGLCAIDYPRDRYEIVVVDDGSDAETERAVGEFLSGPVEITYTAQSNQGSATARNRGARLASGELLIFCDDDIIVQRPHAEQHLGMHEAYGDCLVNGQWEFSPAALAALRATPFGRFRISLEERFRSVATERTIGDGCIEPATLSACNLSMRSDLFWELGGFDEAFPWAGAEDQDFSLRAKRAGHRLVRNNAIKLLHNDPTVTFRKFCVREERAAETVAVLAHKHPDAYASLEYVVENGAVSRKDPPGLLLKKVAKLALSNQPALAVGHRAVEVLERAGIAEARLERLYSVIVGFHMFRGVHRQLRALGAS